MTQAKNLVFIPGLSYLNKMWDGVINSVDGKKYNCYSVTLQEYGSIYNGKCLNFESYPDYIKDALHKKGIRPPYVLVGQSLGGLITLKYIERYPDDVESIVIVSTPLKKTNNKVPSYWKYFIELGCRSRLLGTLVSKAPQVLVLFSRNSKVAELIELIGFLRVSSLRSVCSCYRDLFKYDFTPAIEKIQKPVLIIYGTGDKVMIKFGGIDLYNDFKKASIINYPCSHSVPELHPKELAQQIDKFLSTQE